MNSALHHNPPISNPTDIVSNTPRPRQHPATYLEKDGNFPNGPFRPKAPPEVYLAAALANRKVERFHQTLLGGWAYKRPYTTNQQRRQALTLFLRTYNHHRPHSSLGGQPPITRLVTHLCGKDN